MPSSALLHRDRLELRGLGEVGVPLVLGDADLRPELGECVFGDAEFPPGLVHPALGHPGGLGEIELLGRSPRIGRVDRRRPRVVGRGPGAARPWTRVGGPRRSRRCRRREGSGWRGGRLPGCPPTWPGWRAGEGCSPNRRSRPRSADRRAVADDLGEVDRDRGERILPVRLLIAAEKQGGGTGEDQGCDEASGEA